MDPLSDVLALLRPRSHQFGGIEAGGDWAVRFDRYDGVKCYAVVVGRCRLALEPTGDAAEDTAEGGVDLVAGDCFLLPRGRPFRLASDLGVTPLPAAALFQGPSNGGIRVIGSGGDVAIVGGHFLLAGDHGGLLTGLLPPVVHIRSDADRAALRWCLDRMRSELADRLPGGHLIVQHLAHMILVQALRLHLASGAGGIGWLFALADRRIGASIAAMHDAPARRWTLDDLATRVGMSRSSFALRFKALVGVAPMAYLTRWRLLQAADRLAGGREPVATVAAALGYRSESAFSAAFRRVLGVSPRRHGRAAAPDPDRENDTGAG
jgi:AraC-like DNA-binding protein